MSNFQSRLKVRKSLRFSSLDGAAASAMGGFTQNYITPFALALKATTLQVGLLSSLPNFFMAFSQLATPYLVERAGSRKAIILPTVLIQAIMWLPVFLLPYLFPGSGVWWLIGLFTIGSVLAALANPAWGSMMADLVPGNIRGRYFSFRGRIVTVTTLVFSLIAGFLLQLFTHNVFIGFAIIFGGALLFRLLSLYFLSRMYEPPLIQQETKTSGLFKMIIKLGSTNVGRFTIFMSLIYCAIMIPGPFFSVYMLRDLQLNYMTFTLINASSTVATILFLPFWGRRADRAGNLKIIKITSALLPIIPLLWLVSTNPWYLMAANTFSGFVWSGFDLSCTNFLYDASEAKTRTKQIAVFNAITSMAASIGAIIGGYIAPHLPETLGFQLRTLFVFSGLVRGVIVLLILRTIVEVRNVSGISTFHLLLGRMNHNHGNKH
jgi:MFS family permease